MSRAWLQGLLLLVGCTTSVPEPIFAPPAPSDLQFQRAEVVQKQLEYAVGQPAENNLVLADLLSSMGLRHSATIYLSRAIDNTEDENWIRSAQDTLALESLALGIDPREDGLFKQVGQSFNGSVLSSNQLRWNLLLGDAPEALPPEADSQLLTAWALHQQQSGLCEEALNTSYLALKRLKRELGDDHALTQSALSRKKRLDGLEGLNTEKKPSSQPSYQTGLLLNSSPETAPPLHRLEANDPAVHRLPPLVKNWLIPYPESIIRMTQAQCALKLSQFKAARSYTRLLLDNPLLAHEAQLLLAKSALEQHAIAQAVSILEPLTQEKTLTAFKAINIMRDIKPRNMLLREQGKTLKTDLIKDLNAFVERHQAHPHTALYAVYQQWMGVGTALPKDLAAALSLNQELHWAGVRIQSLEEELLLASTFPPQWQSSRVGQRVSGLLLQDAQQLRDYAGHLILELAQNTATDIHNTFESMRGKDNLWNELQPMFNP